MLACGEASLVGHRPRTADALPVATTPRASRSSFFSTEKPSACLHAPFPLGPGNRAASSLSGCGRRHRARHRHRPNRRCPGRSFGLLGRTSRANEQPCASSTTLLARRRGPTPYSPVDYVLRAPGSSGVGSATLGSSRSRTKMRPAPRTSCSAGRLYGLSAASARRALRGAHRVFDLDSLPPTGPSAPTLRPSPQASMSRSDHGTARVACFLDERNHGLDPQKPGETFGNSWSSRGTAGTTVFLTTHYLMRSRPALRPGKRSSTTAGSIRARRPY